MMHPYIEGNICAAQAALAKLIAELEAATKAGDPKAWAHVGLALGYAAIARAKLNDAMELQEMATTAGEETAA